ncbi:chaperone NapD [Caminibacter pacificus]|uniref:Chaperone NapD n=1 Tax=Caminibacter pacificus TaxID=1424653 RepID=A0AAJ4RDK0_9BACT|nr:chaperone NapD [Caminibacter pacificus]NPA88477.1 chaperone NapD [Campylobacterota bacterium]QCI28672.1 nitrate reductase [Caminibacter pacificus]ROR40599.1 periplasmic nitrate reductase chaperone NapD [Caminibacter pacificus]
MNISSIIVKTLPQNYDSVWMNLIDSGLCEVHFGDKEKGIIIITIEGKNVEEEIDKLTKIQDIPYVISADMHMSYCEEELEEMKKDMDLNATVEELNTDRKAEEVGYFGSLKGKY